MQMYPTPRLKTNRYSALAVCFLFLTSCGGGGSESPSPPPAAAVSPPSNPDNRVTFTPFSYSFNLPVSGPLTLRYRTGAFQASASFKRTSEYRIDDYGFFEVVAEGTNPGCPREECFEEYAAPGPWNHRPYQILSTDINRDGAKDFYVFEWIHGTREQAPDDLAHAFINDGNGHFRLANNEVFDGGKACLHQGGEFPKDITSKVKSSACGYTLGGPRHILLADFNGDGMDDIFAGMVLHLSDKGRLFNRTLTHLPEYFRSSHMGPLFNHDQYAADVDKDGDLDIFIPSIHKAEPGKWGDGTSISGCATCVATVPWSILINDGKGKFILNQNVPILGVGATHPRLVEYMSYTTPVRGILWPGQPESFFVTTTAIADFNGDGFGDIAVGWFNPRVSESWGFGKSSLGVIYLNDGQNNWTTRQPVPLPKSWYGDNGNANDMTVMDFNKDGWMDIVVASTRQTPNYYEGRVIQFLENNKDGTFKDVTTVRHPRAAFYENGTGTPLFNGEGELIILDFDGDGDPDIVDSVSYTYVLINDGQGIFSLKQHTSFPEVDGKPAHLWPVDINRRGLIDFISHRTQCDATSCTTSYFQVVD